MRKLIRIGFETYIGNLYKQGKVTLREAARLLKLSQIETMNLFLDAGIKGNLDASDVLAFTGEICIKINSDFLHAGLVSVTIVIDDHKISFNIVLILIIP